MYSQEDLDNAVDKAVKEEHRLTNIEWETKINKRFRKAVYGVGSLFMTAIAWMIVNNIFNIIQ